MQAQLQTFERKLDALLYGVSELLTRYDQSERTIIAALSAKLDQTQTTLIHHLLDAAERQQLSQSEMLQLISGAQQALARPQAQSLAERDRLAEALSDTSLDVKHKLKLALPLIPTVLEWEAEIELGSGVTLGDVWRELKAKVWK